VRTLLHADFEDDRGCTPCGCAPLPCLGEVEFFFGKNCGGGAKTGETVAPFSGPCSEVIDSDGEDDDEDRPRARFRPDEDAPKCTPLASQPVGAATAVAPTTVCCME